LDTSVEGIITISEQGLVESMNPSAERMFGYSQQELIGQNVSILMPSPDRQQHDGYLKKYRETGEKKIIGVGRDVVGQRKDNSTFPMHLSVSEVKLSTGRIFTGFVYDLTEREAAAEKLRKLNNELELRVKERTQELEQAHEELVKKERLATLGQLAGGVAHEIRNPLGVIRNATYFLRQTSPDEENVQDSFEEIERALANSNHIVNELLDYAREPQTAYIEFAPQTAIENALSMLQIPSEITLVRNDDDASLCVGDQGQIERILVNLINNGLQAMPHGGTLTLAAAKIDQNVSIEVSDTGVGIPVEHLDKIFDPLFTAKAKGIGLGLAISRRYAELNSGQIQAESAPNSGSTFRLTLPCAAES